MNFWHIQLHPDNKESFPPDKVKNYLNNTSIIGLGDWEDGEVQIEQFTNQMQIGDIVAVKSGHTPIALVEIVSDHFYADEDEFDGSFDWMNNRREVKILDLYKDEYKFEIPQPRGTLSRCANLKKETSKIIINWYKKVLNMKNIQEAINLLKYKHQIILQGPPGTGKTRSATLIAEKLTEKGGYYKLVQFHPAYSYEDFVRGIVTKTNNGQIEYIAENKVLAKIAKDAIKNLEDSKKKPEELSKENWTNEQLMKYACCIIDKLNNGDLVNLTDTAKIMTVEDDGFKCKRYENDSNYFTIKFIDIIQAYIGLYLESPSVKIKENQNLSKSARSGMYYLYQKLVEQFKSFLSNEGLSYENPQSNQQSVIENNYILIIDEINRANLPDVLGELIYAL
jgi:hypothetical protein